MNDSNESDTHHDKPIDEDVSFRVSDYRFGLVWHSSRDLLADFGMSLIVGDGCGAVYL